MAPPSDKSGGKKGGTPKRSSGRTGGRMLHTKVKTARGRKSASTRWLQRQLNDPYVARAKQEGYRSRAAYKLLEIEEKHHLIKPGQWLVDLGAAPGGWTQVLVDLSKAKPSETPRIVAIDRLAMEPMPGTTVMELDFTDDDAPAQIISTIEGRADGVLSDMAPSFTGHAPTDHLRTMMLVELAWDLAKDILSEGGFFVAKIIQGSDEQAFVSMLRPLFKSVHYMKPPASRKDSAEHYLIAKGFKGN